MCHTCLAGIDCGAPTPPFQKGDLFRQEASKAHRSEQATRQHPDASHEAYRNPERDRRQSFISRGFVKQQELFLFSQVFFQIQREREGDHYDTSIHYDNKSNANTESSTSSNSSTDSDSV